MKVAIIDSGINREFVDFKNCTINVINMIDHNNADLLGHGTATCAQIVQYQGIGDYLILKIFTSSERTTLLNLIKALEICKEYDDIKLINLSLAFEIIDDQIVKYLKTIVQELMEQGKIIICSKANKRSCSYLSCLSNVIGVELKYTPKSDREYFVFDSTNFNCLYFSPIKLMPCKNNNYTYYYGNSAATAMLTGNLMRYTDGNRKSVLEFLNNNNIEDLKIRKKVSQYFCEECVYKYIDDLLQGTHKDIFRKYKSLQQCFSIDESIELLKKIEDDFEIKLKYSEFTSFDFTHLQNFVKRLNTSVIY